MTIEAMRERQGRNAILGERAAIAILHEGLAASTWREKHPQAWKDLCEYEFDIAGSVEKTLNRCRMISARQEQNHE